MYANFSCFSSLDVLLLQTLRSLKDPTSMPYLEMSLPVRSGSHPPGTQNPTAMRGGGLADVGRCRLLPLGGRKETHIW